MLFLITESAILPSLRYKQKKLYDFGHNQMAMLKSCLFATGRKYVKENAVLIVYSFIIMRPVTGAILDILMKAS